MGSQRVRHDSSDFHFTFGKLIQSQALWLHVGSWKGHLMVRTHDFFACKTGMSVSQVLLPLVRWQSRSWRAAAEMKGVQQRSQPFSQKTQHAWLAWIPGRLCWMGPNSTLPGTRGRACWLWKICRNLIFQLAPLLLLTDLQILKPFAAQNIESLTSTF